MFVHLTSIEKLALKKILAYCLFIFAALSSSAQYFLRGNIRDEKSMPLPNAKILLHSSKIGSSTDRDGSFGLVCKSQTDTITVSLDGFNSKTIFVKTDVWQNIVLKAEDDAVIKNTPKLFSFAKDAKVKEKYNVAVHDETYFKLLENEFINAAQYPYTGFSLNVNKASYSNARRFINMSSQVPPDYISLLL